MGAAESREHSHDHLKEDINTTPIQNRRILKLQDPRSPTEEIHRTPIVADASEFQDPRSPTAEICRTPVTDTSDPRSPTEGIPRTPANPFIFPDPRSPSIGITRTPMIKTIQEDENHPEADNRTDELRRRNVNESGDSKNQTKNNNANNAEDNRLKNIEDGEEKTNNEKKTEAKTTKDSSLEQIDTPNFEVELAKMNLDDSIPKEVQDDSQCATLVLSNAESRVKYREITAKRSLKENFQASITEKSRSPLSSRNVLQNSPSVHNNSPLRTSTKHSNGTVRPTRLIGRYGTASLDKENM